MSMPDKPLKAPPRRYTIGDLSRAFGVTPRALRFYEECGILAPTRVGVQRVFSPRDRARLTLTLRGRRIGLTLREIREILDTHDRAGEIPQDALALSIFRRRIIELERERERIDSALVELSGHLQAPARDEPARVA